MLPDRVSNPGPLTYESGALPIALRGPATGKLLTKQKMDTSFFKSGRKGSEKRDGFHLTHAVPMILRSCDPSAPTTMIHLHLQHSSSGHSLWI